VNLTLPLRECGIGIGTYVQYTGLKIDSTCWDGQHLLGWTAPVGMTAPYKATNRPRNNLANLLVIYLMDQGILRSFPEFVASLDPDKLGGA
jgi:hypothetical protein